MTVSNSSTPVLVLIPLCDPEHRFSVVLCTAYDESGLVGYEEANRACLERADLPCPVGCGAPHSVIDIARALELELIVADENASAICLGIAQIIAYLLRLSTGKAA